MDQCVQRSGNRDKKIGFLDRVNLVCTILRGNGKEFFVKECERIYEEEFARIARGIGEPVKYLDEASLVITGHIQSLGRCCVLPLKILRDQDKRYEFDRAVEFETRVLQIFYHLFVRSGLDVNKISIEKYLAEN